MIWYMKCWLLPAWLLQHHNASWRGPRCRCGLSPPIPWTVDGDDGRVHVYLQRCGARLPACCALCVSLCVHWSVCCTLCTRMCVCVGSWQVVGPVCHWYPQGRSSSWSYVAFTLHSARWFSYSATPCERGMTRRARRPLWSVKQCWTWAHRLAGSTANHRRATSSFAFSYVNGINYDVKVRQDCLHGLWPLPLLQCYISF